MNDAAAVRVANEVEVREIAQALLAEGNMILSGQLDPVGYLLRDCRTIAIAHHQTPEYSGPLRVILWSGGAEFVTVLRRVSGAWSALHGELAALPGGA